MPKITIASRSIRWRLEGGCTEPGSSRIETAGRSAARPAGARESEARTGSANVPMKPRRKQSRETRGPSGVTRRPSSADLPGEVNDAEDVGGGRPAKSD